MSNTCGSTETLSIDNRLGFFHNRQDAGNIMLGVIFFRRPCGGFFQTVSFLLNIIFHISADSKKSVSQQMFSLMQLGAFMLWESFLMIHYTMIDFLCFW